jgi:hypothetical protein
MAETTPNGGLGVVIDIIGYKNGGLCAIDYDENLAQFELSPVPIAN